MGNIKVITGNGKGKTTSAIGIMMKEAIVDKKIYFGQFMKGGNYNEIKSLARAFPKITIDQYTGGFVLIKSPQERDMLVAQEGLRKAKEAVGSGIYDLVVLDEINIVLFLETISKEETLEMLKKIPQKTDILLTGRYADPDILAIADEAYEILQIKHYFNEGVPARAGIEM